MEDVSPRVDVLSETIALSTCGNTKNIIITAMDVKGPFDVQAGEEAARRASQSFPQLMSCIREVSSRGVHYLEWERRLDEPLPVFLAEMPESCRTDNLLDDMIRVMKPRLERDWDLFRQIAVEFHFIRLGPERNLMASVCHHVAGDGGTASESGREFLLNYHQIMRGSKPEWAKDEPALSTVRKRPVRTQLKGWAETIRESHRGFMQIFERPLEPIGTGSKTDLSQHLAKRLLSEEQSAAVFFSALQSGVNFVDSLTACANLAIDTWNSRRGGKSGLLTTAMTVNTRGRFSEYDTPNNSSVIVFRSLPEQRKDPSDFLRHLARMRIRHFREQRDVTMLHNIRRLNRSLRLFPYHVRRLLMHLFLQNHRFSIAVTLLGTVWPKLVNGRPTGDSSVTTSADLEVSEVHGIGYKLHSGTRLLLIAYAYRNRLNLILEAAGSLFTREETESFLDLIVEMLFSDILVMDGARGRRSTGSSRRSIGGEASQA
ncbi:MAG: hypothetical protein QG577_302 [Thermodesulfobacteriota bacterium]|nr:hypothetical protein [Thermodesulfobacteriota bacterium]